MKNEQDVPYSAPAYCRPVLGSGSGGFWLSFLAAILLVPLARADMVMLHDDFSGIAVGTRPSSPYEFQGLAPTPPGDDGLIVEDSGLLALAMRRLEPNPEFPLPTVTRVFPRLIFGDGREVELSFDLKLKSETGTTLQFHVRNDFSGSDGDGQMVYFDPAQGFWLLDGTRVKHPIVNGALDGGVWYHVTMTFDLENRTAHVTVSNAQSEEVLGKSPQIDLFGKTAQYLDRLVIARAEEHVTYDYEFTNLTLRE